MKIFRTTGPFRFPVNIIGTSAVDVGRIRSNGIYWNKKLVVQMDFVLLLIKKKIEFSRKLNNFNGNSFPNDQLGFLIQKYVSFPNHFMIFFCTVFCLFS